MFQLLLFTAALADAPSLPPAHEIVPALEAVLPLEEAAPNDHFIVRSHVGDSLTLLHEGEVMAVDIVPVDHAPFTLLEVVPAEPMTPGVWTLLPTSEFDPVQWRVGGEPDDAAPATPSVQDVVWRTAVGGYRFLEFDLVLDEPVLWEVTATTVLSRDTVVSPVVRTLAYLDNDALDDSVVTMSVRARDAAGNWSEAIEWTGTPRVAEPLQGVRSRGCTTGGGAPGWSWLVGGLLFGASRRRAGRRTCRQPA